MTMYLQGTIGYGSPSGRLGRIHHYTMKSINEGYGTFEKVHTFCGIIVGKALKVPKAANCKTCLRVAKTMRIDRRGNVKLPRSWKKSPR